MGPQDTLTTAPPEAGAAVVEALRFQAGIVHAVVRMNAAGISHAESLVAPQPAGNCLNWAVGHLLHVENRILGLLGQQPVLPPEKLERYARGSRPLTEASEALPLDELLAAWDEAAARLDAGLAALPPGRLADPAPESPTGNPDETVRTLLLTVMFHQAYHAGQLGVLRRIAGKPGAIP